MSLKQLFDTDEEKAYWFSAISRLCAAISVSVIVSGNGLFALITIGIGAASSEIAGYYKLQMSPKKDEPKP